jgi:hypothetical protein
VKYAGGEGSEAANIIGFIDGNNDMVDKLEVVQDLENDLIGIR